MERDQVLPYLNKFITVTLEDGSLRSGYVTNPQDFKSPDDHPSELDLVNGFLIENVPLDQIVKIEIQNRENTVSLPVVDLKKGYGVEEEQ